MKKRTLTLLLTLFLLTAPSVMAHDGTIHTGCTEPGTTSGLPDRVMHTERTEGIMWTGLNDGTIWPMLTDGLILPWLTNGIITTW